MFISFRYTTLTAIVAGNELLLCQGRDKIVLPKRVCSCEYSQFGHGNRMCYDYVYVKFYVPECTIPLKTIKIADFAVIATDGIFWLSIVTSLQLICDDTRTRVTGIVTPYSSIVLARANWHNVDLY